MQLAVTQGGKVLLPHSIWGHLEPVGSSSPWLSPGLAVSTALCCRARGCTEGGVGPMLVQCPVLQWYMPRGWAEQRAGLQLAQHCFRKQLGQSKGTFSWHLHGGEQWAGLMALCPHLGSGLVLCWGHRAPRGWCAPGQRPLGLGAPRPPKAPCRHYGPNPSLQAAPTACPSAACGAVPAAVPSVPQRSAPLPSLGWHPCGLGSVWP